MGAGLVAGLLTTVLSGCGPSGGDSGPSSGVAPSSLNKLGLEVDVPQSYDPCTDVPQSVLDSEKLHAAAVPNTENASGLGGIIWEGCGWVQSKGYAVSIRVTNMTLAFVRKNATFYNEGQEVTIGGRPAITARRTTEAPSEVCSINVEIKGGSLEFHLDNPPSRTTGNIDTCQLGLALAEKVVPTLPAGA
ncbi:DUF3558 domain-containing protein [Nocardia sp. NPDC005366]|uniref:DUF3558 domain-containing protein n=1 Tax=Nocardia sp. NPDC005366 TaxID=3156878 RepID=UPI0033ADA896